MGGKVGAMVAREVEHGAVEVEHDVVDVKGMAGRVCPGVAYHFDGGVVSGPHLEGVGLCSQEAGGMDVVWVGLGEVRVLDGGVDEDEDRIGGSVETPDGCSKAGPPVVLGVGGGGRVGGMASWDVVGDVVDANRGVELAGCRAVKVDVACRGTLREKGDAPSLRRTQCTYDCGG